MVDLSSIHRAMSRGVDAVFNFVFPPICLVCDARLSSGERLVCIHCWRSLPRLAEEARIPPPTFRENQQVIDEHGAVWQYSDAIQKIIFALKYNRNRSLAKRLGAEMAELAQASGFCCGNTYLVPVPLHPTKLRERGYNQSELLAGEIAAATGMTVKDNLIVRSRYTKTQVKLSAEQRMRNVHGAFALRAREGLSGRTILLIDDVLTTGATTLACGRLLKQAGALRVFVLTAAQAILRPTGFASPR